MKSAAIDYYLRLGMKARLESIQRELDEIHSVHPDLLPNSSRIAVIPAEAKTVGNKAAKAKALIAGAEALGKNGSTKRTLTINEAAKILGMTPAGVDYHVKHKNLDVHKRDPEGRKFLRSKVVALGAALGKEIK